MKTQIAFSDKLNQVKYNALSGQARRLGVIRSEIWQRFGSVKGIKLSDRTIRDSWLKEGRKFNVNANTWKQTLSDTIDNIKANRMAAKVKVKRSIREKTKESVEQKRLYTLLKSENWNEDSYLSRMMRKAWYRGHNKTHNQINVRSGDYTIFTLKDKIWLKVPSLIKGKRISIPLNSSIEPKGNLRLILCDSKVEIHYASEIIETND